MKENPITTLYSHLSDKELQEEIRKLRKEIAKSINSPETRNKLFQARLEMHFRSMA